MSFSRACTCLLVVLVAFLQGSSGANSPHLAGSEYVFRLKNGNKDCFYASFKLNFKISYYGYPNISDKSVIDVLSTEIALPNNTQVTIEGDCGKTLTNLTLSWMSGGSVFSSTFEFEINNSSWYLSTATFAFTMDALMNPVDTGKQVYVTNPNVTDLFKRDYSPHQYLYCEKCKTLEFKDCSDEALGACINPCPIKISKDKNETHCSDVEIMQTILFPGDFEQSPERKLCIEDYIALQELIVPIVVGGLLGILLVLIFVAYIIAYIRRRRREGKYERVGDN